MKKKSIINCSLIFLFSFSIVGTGFLNENTNNYSLINNFSFKSINSNSKNIYDENYLNTFKVDLRNKFLKKEFIFNSNKINLVSSLKTANELLFKNSIKNIDDPYIDYNSAYLDFLNGQILEKENLFNIKPIDHSLPYKTKVSCNKKHSKLVLVCKNPNHFVHNNRCWKVQYYDCYGCTDAIVQEKTEKVFDQKEFDTFLRMSMINLNDFDFSHLIKIDAENSKKLLNKNILSFSFNEEYLKFYIMFSFNYWLSLNFDNESWMFTEKQKEIILKGILQNKITIFDHYVPKSLGYSNNNYEVKHNLRYWQENINDFSNKKLELEFNQLPILDFGQFGNKNNFLKNIFIGSTLFKLFNNSKYLENIIFEIFYYEGNSDTLKSKTISLKDLIFKKNNKIIYSFDLLNDINTKYQALRIPKITLKSKNNNIIYVDKTNIGLVYEDQLVSLDKNEFVYNPLLNISNLLSVNEIDENESKQFLINNKIFGLPSDNMNEYTFSKLISFEKYLSFTDEYFEIADLIKEIDVHPSDLNGSMDIKITFNDDTNVDYLVNGFDKISIDQIVYDFNDILSVENNDQNYTGDDFLEKFISYKDQKNPIFFIKTSLNKNEFIQNFIDSIQIINDDNALIFKVIFKNNDHLVSKDFKLVFSQNDSDDNDDKNENPVNKKQLDTKLLIYVVVALIIFVSVLLLFFIIWKIRKK